MAAAGSVAFLLIPQRRMSCVAVVAAYRTRNKHAHRLLSSLVLVNPADADRLIRKFVARSSKKTALEALFHLMSLPDYPTLAVSMYQAIAEAPWSQWFPDHAAAAAALLEKIGRLPEAEALIHESTSAARSPGEKELFYCALMKEAARQGLESRVLFTHALLRSKSGPITTRAHEAAVQAFCLLGMLQEAEAAATERPSESVKRAVALAYGNLGLFEDMERVIDTTTTTKGHEFSVNNPMANVAIACYGKRGMIREIVSWLRRMREAKTPITVSTFNAALYACPTVYAMAGGNGGAGLDAPISLAAMARVLEGSDEADVLAELTAGPAAERVLRETAVWGDSEWKLDLHGCHPGTALVVLMIWVEELRERLLTREVRKEDLAVEVVVMCGAGAHSRIRGVSPVRMMVARVATAMRGPLHRDRMNKGRYIAKGKAIKDWLFDLSFKSK